MISRKINPLIFSLLIGASCGDVKDEKQGPGPQVPGQEEIVSFTAKDATTAFDAFNKYFYDTDAKLYHSTTKRDQLAQGWTQAVFWDIVMDAYLRTENPGYLEMIREIYEGGNHAYSDFNWNDVKTVNDFIYDDMMWWVIALARGYVITADQEYLDKAIDGFDFVWEEAFDAVNGGMRWSWKVEGKVAAINYPTVIAAMYLYNITGKDTYLAKAKNIYSWAQKTLFQETTGRVADHIVDGSPPGFEDYTYNQGVCIGAAVMLYRITGSKSYLNDARLAADYTYSTMSDSDGILPAEGDWNEQGVLKAIFARYAYMLIDEGEEQYEAWLRKNASLAWSNRDTARNLMFRDYRVKCPEGDFQSYEASSAVGIMQVCPPG